MALSWAARGYRWDGMSTAGLLECLNSYAVAPALPAGATFFFFEIIENMEILSIFRSKMIFESLSTLSVISGNTTVYLVHPEAASS